MWTLLAFISALCLGCYDVSKKIALRDNTVVDVLAVSICVSAFILSVPLLLSRFCPEVTAGTLFYVPKLDTQAQLYTLLKSVIVLSSWVFAYVSMKHLPLSLVSPMQATRPMWTLAGALLIFNEQLNAWQWTGVLMAIGTIFAFSLHNRLPLRLQKKAERRKYPESGRYYIFLALAILTGACSGLYDKYLMRNYDHNAVQVYYTLYQAAMMIVVRGVIRSRELRKGRRTGTTGSKLSGLRRLAPGSLLAVVLISVFLVISDNTYMLALRDPDSMIAVVSTIRRGGTVIGFGYGLLFLKESDPWHKLLCMLGISAGLLCLAIGSA